MENLINKITYQNNLNIADFIKKKKKWKLRTLPSQNEMARKSNSH